MEKLGAESVKRAAEYMRVAIFGIRAAPRERRWIAVCPLAPSALCTYSVSLLCLSVPSPYSQQQQTSRDRARERREMYGQTMAPKMIGLTKKQRQKQRRER